MTKNILSSCHLIKSMTAAIEMRGIVKHFGPVIANNGVSLHVEAGEVLALLGESGVAAYAHRYGLAVQLASPVGLLSVGEQQRVEILKALHRNTRVLILD